MTEVKLQSIFKTLPVHCVILAKDVEAAGIGRGDLVQAKKGSKEKEKAGQALVRDDWSNPSEKDPREQSGDVLSEK